MFKGPPIVQTVANRANCRPEGMGAICAIVYLLVIIFFIPFPFYKDIVEATSGGGLRDEVLHVEHVSLGRHLHRFPHSKVGPSLMTKTRNTRS